MNKERLLAVAEAIENDPGMYDQEAWGSPWCGSAGCVAGYAIALFHDDDTVTKHLASRNYDQSGFAGSAQEILALSEREMFGLFASNWPIDWLPDYDGKDNRTFIGDFNPTAQDAGRVLRKLASGELKI